MIYKINIEKKVLKFIEKQPMNKRKLILTAIYSLPSGDTKIMKGHINLFRLRVSDYRIIYTIQNDVLIIKVIDIGNRGQIYNKY
ncbi:type II toxin-antitoxin system RelE/ParE family toxin [Sedimentibacter hydroxybenzoicus DSM 7310]|uniref:Type II toxin-antitoxin system RelE/ParE family toxin n=1 Tax=Sedimentibacter hydroxybenzoicus DSM 7310 TaxID=1123245 RepID=A0A974GXP1_SEDHY|nr:type II toxin-antitoxin system RelE/ParE family toxin [Sedimentibacter hydroxybenzoicus]NYB75396.1 type II toxin-antitoxin system RelE/ParE family toxin [Sedimentibacter hydroxybenzoicus DSM 7310]